MKRRFEVPRERSKENENKELEYQTMKIESIQQQNDMKSQITIAKRNL